MKTILMTSAKWLVGSASVYTCIYLLTFITKTSSSSTNQTMSTVLYEIFTGYDKKLPPNYDKNETEKQVDVVVSLFINSLFSVREAEMDYSISVFVRERWVDDRLKYDDVSNLTRLELDRSMFDALWMPDLFILNEKESDYHEVTVPNKMIHIYPNGTIQYSARVTGIFSCRMFLHKFPFDTQTCRFDLESYGHSMDNLKLTWGETAVSKSDDIHLSNFFIRDVDFCKCDKKYFGIEFPCVGAKFVFERNYEYYILQVYLPSTLIVVLSWVSFWLDCTAVPARISLGLLTVLTMTTQSTSAREHLPRVSYLKAIDVYMAACLTFVFLGLVEFAYVNVLTRVEQRRFVSRKSEEVEVNGNVIEEIKEMNENQSQKKRKRRGINCCQTLSNMGRARLVDKVSFNPYYPANPDRKAFANSLEPDQTPSNSASDQVPKLFAKA